jgi:hypothetical protein
MRGSNEKEFGMSRELGLAAEYRHHARNLLAAAQFDLVEQTRLTLVRIANDFEKMADDLEGVDRTNKMLRRHKSSSLTSELARGAPNAK